MKSIVTDKQVVVVGLGKTGLSCVRYLSQLGYSIIVMDTRLMPPNLSELHKNFTHITTILGRLDQDVLCSVNEIILSPGIALASKEIQAAIAAGVRVRGDIDLFVEAAKAPVVAITGSNGKSTVTTLLGDMAVNSGLNVGVGGNLGTPALELLSADKQLYVLELSSFQLETTESLNAECVVLLNVTEDHMDRYVNKMAYLQAKQRVFRGAKHVVINDDEVLSQPLATIDMKLVHFGLSSPDLKKFSINERNGERFISFGFDDLLSVKELKLKGQHNLSNALAALALGSVVGLPTAVMLETLKVYKGLLHRCEYLRTINSVDYINDSKATNAGATVTAINSFGEESSGKVILIAGGDSKDADLSPLINPMAAYGKLAILIGSDADKIEQVLCNTVEIEKVNSLEEAVHLAKQQAKAGDVVLLSPACASFDMFDNYIHRGEVFSKEVASL
ncbi:MAG: UDP-N-acetylmuramoylalanine--D-glutamate ligase [Oleiphilaceae bacterium]